MSIPARLKAAREAKQLGRHIVRRIITTGSDGRPKYPIAQTTLDRWETEGHTSYNVELLIRVCAIYGITVESLTEETAPQPHCAATYARAHSAGDHDAAFERKCPLCKDLIAR